VKKFLFIALLCIYFSPSKAQIPVHAVVLDEKNKPVSGVEIFTSDDIIATTDANGKFEFTSKFFPVFINGSINKEKVLGHKFTKQPLSNDKIDTLFLNQGMDIILMVEIRGGDKGIFDEEVKTKELKLNPSIGSGIESIIQTLGGVSSGNEMSSQFSVRGGNFDENLIYVNDIEIFRPQLISSGQQEGLSFINPDLVNSIKFSAGGFEAQYGDKMSSVLDVEYVKPTTFKSQVNLGTMLNSVSVEGSRKKWAGLVSFRNFSNSLLTSSLNTAGTYSMAYRDVQAYLEWKPTKFWNINFLGNIANNAFTLLPQSRSTEFGTVQQAYQLSVNMAGQENMNYAYNLGALTAVYRPNLKNTFKWILSITDITEQEYFDVEGAYRLSELDRDMSSKSYGKPLRTLGYGYYLNHGRNQMRSQIVNFSHLGQIGKVTAKTSFKYGLRINNEIVKDRFLQWLYNDSADYNIAPNSFAIDSILLDNSVRSNNQIQSIRTSAFVQGQFLLNKKQNIWMNLGVRGQYWDFNQDLIIMPRLNLKWEPNKNYNSNVADSLKKQDITYKLAIGAYNQPPFYRELRDFQGKIHTDVVSQKSWHFVAGIDKYLTFWNRRFKYTVEGYYKQMNQLVPYLYENIRIRYYANNNANGYAWGVDNRIYGQFNKGLESWFTMSIMQTQEKITYLNDKGEMTTSDWLRRPTDKRVNFAIVFQDHLAKYPSIRVNLRLVVGTGMPYFLDGQYRYTTNPNVIPPYRRLDMGFSKILIKSTKGDKKAPKKNPFGLDEAWFSIDIFNLLDINNVISYSWVKDLSNNKYGVPEYLTGRRINARVYMVF
jgi:hypothetical protein